LPLKSGLFGLPDGFPNQVANFISLSTNAMRNSLKDFKIPSVLNNRRHGVS